MTQRCIFSKHIPFHTMNEEDVERILADIRLFNRMKWEATSELLKSSSVPDTTGIDLRRKENEALRKSLPDSLHVRLKKEFGCTDYFTNSAERLASGLISSVKTNRKEYVRDLKVRQKEISSKLRKTNKHIAKLERVKQYLILATRDNDPKKIKSLPYCVYKDGKWIMKRCDKVVRIYENTYLFETQYLDPKIYRLKAKARLLGNKIVHIDKRIEELEDISICFGSKKLYKKQRTVYTDHTVWKSVWDKKRNRSMTLGGRKDSRHGNYLCTYDPVRHVLIYRTAKNRYIEIPGVEFPYKQDELNEVVRNGYTAIGWIIEVTGRSFLIKCVYTIPERNKLSDTENGVIGIDMNADNISWTETDENGNIEDHGIIRFDLRNKSSEHTEHVLSYVLEEIYAKCRKAGKPLVMEDISIRKTFQVYNRNKKKNQKVSSFAYSKLTSLAVSKSYKYAIDVLFIDPSYTSQSGKILFMKDYGLSVHEAASVMIARRGMGIYDNVPDYIYEHFSEELKQKDFKPQWYAASKYIKQFKPIDIYRGALTKEMITALDYKF